MGKYWLRNPKTKFSDQVLSRHSQHKGDDLPQRDSELVSGTKAEDRGRGRREREKRRGEKRGKEEGGSRGFVLEDKGLPLGREEAKHGT